MNLRRQKIEDELVGSLAMDCISFVPLNLKQLGADGDGGLRQMKMKKKEMRNKVLQAVTQILVGLNPRHYLQVKDYMPTPCAGTLEDSTT
ncbi:hypothetical protein L6452_13761 [Arctium lappa]|uniref:Uncharacterized protein n=1 Tax=Arctium lappa TaxID=4217 RepID=A0ACB9CJ36_ARCLA|nr:hypothetical protein L6452_13761 [Arctium lappa]